MLAVTALDMLFAQKVAVYETEKISVTDKAVAWRRGLIMVRAGAVQWKAKTSKMLRILH